MKIAVAAVAALAAVGLLAVVWHRLRVEIEEEEGSAVRAAGGAPVSTEALRAEDEAPGTPYESWYPADITPPAGTKYPCEVTAVPKDLAGIPASHHRYIDHAFSLILRATHERLKVWEALGPAAPDPAALENYVAATGEICKKLQAEPVPESLRPFQEDVLRALQLQVTFFEKAFTLRRSGVNYPEWTIVPEGRTASGSLITAWGRIQARYPKMSRAMSNALMHHLCALDIF